jgi:hypothetical protein
MAVSRGAASMRGIAVANPPMETFTSPAAARVASSRASQPTSPGLLARHLRLDDIDRLVELEHRQWTPRQAASAAVMRQRLDAWPALCLGVFCPRSGAALASAFLRPVDKDHAEQARTWHECANADDTARPHAASACLFGISMTSIDPGAVAPMLRLLWVQAVQQGWRDIYLGSPIPGLRRALQRDCTLHVEQYVRQRRHGLPADPQLRYYHGKGFRDVVAVRPDYFPHEESLDHGVVLRHSLPLREVHWLLRQMPPRVLHRVAGGLYGAAPRATAP